MELDRKSQKSILRTARLQRTILNFRNRLLFVELDYDLDVPIEGAILEFDELLGKSRNDILDAMEITHMRLMKFISDF